MKFLRHSRDSVDVNLTPLIDVVFLLLIFFMVSTTFDTRQALELVLPDSGSATAQEASPVTLTITQSGEYRLGEQILDSAQALRQALAAQVESARERGVVIEADTRTTHGAVVVALDQAAALGIQRVRIATRQPAALDSEPLETP
ncbi:ExbD/TolR family protein [Halomonas sp. M20]|uniref:ExbD/TolR family protein n=1 Tax=Halomonas sp. M20 TaxID=2763264 RepID=UPI001D09D9EF|nr:biopolymer transporter ExbD [Halomonas sp. M20]